MPRPTNKETLLQASQDKWEALNRLIDALPDVDKNRELPAGTMNRNIRDVLGHLHVWHLLMLDWYETGMQHQKPDMPAKGYTWKTTPELNRKIDYPHIVQWVDCFSFVSQISPIGAAPFIEMRRISSEPRSGGTGCPVEGAGANAPPDLDRENGYKRSRRYAANCTICG